MAVNILSNVVSSYIESSNVIDPHSAIAVATSEKVVNVNIVESCHVKELTGCQTSCVKIGVPEVPKTLSS